jgi:hypothetical protein
MRLPGLAAHRQPTTPGLTGGLPRVVEGLFRFRRGRSDRQQLPGFAYLKIAVALTGNVARNVGM